jgi:hypothetical protein
MKILKYIAFSLTGILIGASASMVSAQALRILTVPQGGTGAASFTVGDCIKGNGTLAFTSGSCGSSGTTFGQSWEITGAGFLAPTTTITTLLNNGFISQASSSLTNFNAINGTTTNATTTALSVSALSSLTNFTATNGTTTNATSTNIYASGKINIGTNTSAAALTASGGISFATLPFGTASIGHVIHTSGWDGSGFAFANSTAGSKVFSMVYNGDTAFFGLLASGGTSAGLGTWSATGLRVGDGNAAAYTLDVIGSGLTSDIVGKFSGRIAAGAAGTGGMWVDGGSTEFMGSYSSSVMGFYNSGWNLTLNSSGNVGIGTQTQNAHLSIVNNVATGFLDNYSEYQEILFDGGTAGSSYGLGIKSSNLVFNSGAGGYSFDRAGNVTAMAIDTSGNMSIGGSATERLTVVDAGNTNVYSGTFGVYAQNLTQGIAFGYTGISKVGSAANTDLNIDAKGTGNILLQTNSTGKVGIGAAVPGQLLHLNTPTGTDELTQMSINNTTYGYLGIAAASNGVINGSVLGDFGIRSQAKDILFSTDSGSSAQMYLKNGGNVGIATTSPYAALSVVGSTGVVAQMFTATSSNATSTFAGGVGVGTTSPWSKLALGSGAITCPEVTAATSTSMTLDWRTGCTILVRIGTAGVTIAHTGYVAGQRLVVTVCNPHGGTTGTLTWSGVLWDDSTHTVPTQITTVDRCQDWAFQASNGTSTMIIKGYKPSSGGF